MNFEEIKLKNPGILKFSIPQNIFLPVQEKLLATQPGNDTIPFNELLVGQIENEIKFDCPANLKFFLNRAATTFCEYFNYYKNQEISLTNIWANFQKKSEYNPVHLHSGIISFIIFVKIPFSFKNEDELENTKKSLKHCNGRVTFLYQSMFVGGIVDHIIDADHTYEGVLLMFPSKANHAVYPFYTSDEYRISISGNFDTARD